MSPKIGRFDSWSRFFARRLSAALFGVLGGALLTSRAQAGFSTKSSLGGGSVVVEAYTDSNGIRIAQIQDSCTKGDATCSATVPDQYLGTSAPQNRYKGGGAVTVTDLSISISGKFETFGTGSNFTNGGVSVNGTQNIYANVAPGTQVQVTIDGSVSTAASAPAPAIGASANIGTSRIPRTSSISQTYTVTVGQANIVVGGVTYYYVDTLLASGNAGGSLDNGGGNSASFTGSISAQLKVVGPVLEYVSGDGQGPVLTGSALPHPFVVQVVDNISGMPQDGIPITYSVATPPAGGQDAQVLPNSVDTGQFGTGMAAASGSVGSVAGTYTFEARCPSCLFPGDAIPFSVSAITPLQALSLKLISCDPSDIAGRVGTNPMKVRIVDLTNPLSTTVAGYNISFSGTAIASPSAVKSDSSGFAETGVTLPSAPGTYSLTATCSQCEGNPSVTCATQATLPPRSQGGVGSGSYGGPTSGPTPAPGGHNLALSFQVLQPIPGGAPRVVSQKDAVVEHIGVLQGDSLRFAAVFTPPLTGSANLAWSGAASGSAATLDVTFNSAGFFPVTVKDLDGNRSETVNVEVVAKPTMSLRTFCFGSGPVVMAACALTYHSSTSGSLNADTWFTFANQAYFWAYAQRNRFPDGSPGFHNGNADAIRHAYWNALMTRSFGASISRGISSGHEYDEIQENSPQSPHNESVMDLDNNEHGIQIASQFPSLTGNALLQQSVLDAQSNQQLIILDRLDTNNNQDSSGQWHLNALLLPSNTKTP